MKRILLCLTAFISCVAAAENLQRNDTPIFSPVQKAVKTEPQQFIKQTRAYLKGTERETLQQERLILLIEKISINIDIIRDATLRNNEHCLFDGKAYSLGAIHQSLAMECHKNDNGIYYWSK
ncbi:hypothetical protein [Yersinia pekkanenii]|uniref:DUF1496 domain-containing protein n=1 Tax=Yersinia pekkanenii TaxID=1288385 RepID=A0A0T9R387_9GAMM|nr:hypothetical protein [Yersinia pekkanenii]CNI40006.1 Uncharacterised protein [Yersinia pekkanenii]CRY69108.1 Uncharacterised protein [Yersinia pekkanenii]